MTTDKNSFLVAIHDQPDSYSGRWIEVCQERNIPFKIVNGFSKDIIQQLEGVDVILWHWSNREPPALMFARSILAAAEAAGVAVYPNTPTCWHYDDKIAQWFLLNAVEAPTVDTFFFVDKKEAMNWIDNASWPKVFKLKSGSGSRMVRLVENAEKARGLCSQSFRSGFNPTEGLLNDAVLKLSALQTREKLTGFIKKLPKKFKNWRARRKMPREQGYLYFQEFLADNKCDTRITVIGERAFAFRRHVRKNDFRASGSGNIDHDQDSIDIRCVEIAKDVAKKLKVQSIALDFILDEAGDQQIVEISYAFQAEAVHNCPGYWDDEMQWQEGHVWPQDAILEDILRKNGLSI